MAYLEIYKSTKRITAPTKVARELTVFWVDARAADTKPLAQKTRSNQVALEKTPDFFLLVLGFVSPALDDPKRI